jgi:hypothetical protein
MQRWLAHPAAREFIWDLKASQLDALKALLHNYCMESEQMELVREARAMENIISWLERRVDIARAKEEEDRGNDEP